MKEKGKGWNSHVKALSNIGKKFSRLTIIDIGPYDTGGNIKYKCKCDCGNITYVRLYGLRSGLTRSCGCYAMEVKRRHQGCGQVRKTHWNTIIRNAKRRNITVEISLEYASQLFQQQGGLCAITKLPLSFGNTSKSKKNASLDRIDNSLGYIEGNVQWIHKRVNFMKNDMSMQDLLSWCRLIIK